MRFGRNPLSPSSFGDMVGVAPEGWGHPGSKNMDKIVMEKTQTAQATIEGGRVIKTEFRTEDEGPQSFSAGKLDGKGITFYLEKVEVHEGAYTDKQTGEPRPFYTAEGHDINGNPVSLAFGSKRLKRVLDKVMASHGEELNSLMVNISGHGEGFDRNYGVKLVAPSD